MARFRVVAVRIDRQLRPVSYYTNWDVAREFADAAVDLAILTTVAGLLYANEAAKTVYKTGSAVAMLVREVFRHH